MNKDNGWINIDEIQKAIGNPDNKYPFAYARTEDKKDWLHIWLIDPKKAAERVYSLINDKLPNHLINNKL